MLLVGTVLPVTGTSLIDKTTLSNISGNTLYVGGSGVGNYTTIQGAINDALDGDTVFVYDDSSPYYENVVVNKSIFLIGEDKDTTIIDGYENGNVVYVTANEVTISGFTIQNSGSNWNAGIEIRSNSNIITGNTITNNIYGIYLNSSSDITLTGNTISDNGMGIVVHSSSSTITGNNLSNNHVFAIRLIYSYSTKILKNNFFDDMQTKEFALFRYSLINILKRNTWNQNYWSIPRILPKLIQGSMAVIVLPIPWFLIPWFDFDWNPAQEPYDI
jgi:parallel beta-helix repeat protein